MSKVYGDMENLHQENLNIVNAKVGSQETPGVTANLALECGMKQGKD